MVRVGCSQTEISKIRDKVLGRKVRKGDSTDLLLGLFGMLLYCHNAQEGETGRFKELGQFALSCKFVNP